MRPLLHPLLAIGLTAANAWLGYGKFMHLANRIARAAVEVIQPRNTPFLPSVAIAVMPAWCAIEVAVYLLLALAANLPVRTLFGTRFDWTLIPRGVGLGVAEASLSMMIATVAFRLLAPLRDAQRGGDAALDYQTLGQGGWMRTYLSVFRSLPFPAAICIIALPLLSEELIFRATAIPLLLPLGIPPAVAISTVLFMAVQVPRLPSWYHAAGPVSGALVMGACNGLVFATQRNLLLPLIAHVTFLVVIMGRTPLRRE